MLNELDRNYDRSRSWIDIEWVKPNLPPDATDPVIEAFIKKFRENIEALDRKKSK